MSTYEVKKICDVFNSYTLDGDKLPEPKLFDELSESEINTLVKLKDSIIKYVNNPNVSDEDFRTFIKNCVAAEEIKNE
jgi:hypothetical protein